MLIKSGFAESRKTHPKIDTHKEITEHANTSRDKATKIIYINKHLDLKKEEDRQIKKKLELGDEKPGKVCTELKAKKIKKI